MDKPVKHDRRAYDYRECRQYLEERDGYDEGDFAQKWTAPNPDAVPYQDFWHWVIEQVPDISNGCYFTMLESWGQDASPWQQEILDKYLTTFGETDPRTGERYVALYVWW